MRIAFLGTRGIPNNYGGFEQFAEYLSVGLVEYGHDVTVYNPHFHSYKGSKFKGVNIRHIFSPERIFGSAANYIYDYLCLRDALKRGFDIIYEAGYGSVAFSYLILPINKALILTNMDGLEWKREKWNTIAKYLTKKAEEVAIKKSHFLISDNPGIQAYYKDVYGRDSFYLPYGADLVEKFDSTALGEYHVRPSEYYLLIARMEPENNIETILRGFVRSKASEKLILVGNVSSGFGKQMTSYASDARIKFIGGLYDKNHLDSLRHFAKGYFHGHSVGGTNPSLLEAMACGALIISHDNQFNRSVLDNSALYFRDSADITTLLNNIDQRKAFLAGYEEINGKKIARVYTWPKIIYDHHRLFSHLLHTEGARHQERTS